MEECLHEASRDAKQRPTARTLAVRVLVGVVLIPVVLLVTHIGGLAYTGFVAALAALGAYEFTGMAARAGWRPSRPAAVVGSACGVLSFHFGNGALPIHVLTCLVGVVLVERMVRSAREHYLTGVGATLIGAAYAGWLLGYFVWLRRLEPGAAGSGAFLVYFVLVITWAYDSVAYLVGSLVGRHKLLPRVSPSKTVEGTAGGLVGAVVAGLASQATFAPFFGRVEAAILGLALGVIAQAGDLVESMMKRAMGAKDSSNMIPGHGGFLDRFDSLLFAGPAFYLYLRLAAW
ncbi:MAG: phosphatidate cytidylyltransferase [bacterium]